MARRETAHQRVERGLVRAVDISSAALVGDDAAKTDDADHTVRLAPSGPLAPLPAFRALRSGRRERDVRSPGHVRLSKKEATKMMSPAIAARTTKLRTTTRSSLHPPRAGAA